MPPAFIDDNKHLTKYPMPLASRFLDLAVLLNQLITWLGNHFHEKGERYFNFAFKNHMLLHSAWCARHLAPHWGWCYQGEDLMQRAKAVVASVARTRVSRQMVCSESMSKYTCGLSFALARF